MNRATLILAALLLVSPVLAPTAPAQSTEPDTGPSTPTDWEPWFNDTLNVRVPIEPGLGAHYPSSWSGPRMVTHELDVSQALTDAGWPTDAGTGEPQRFTIDLDSIRVIPVGVDDPEPVPMLTWDGALLSAPGAHPPGHRIVTIAFLSDPDVDTYHVYFDRKQDDDTHEPVARDAIAEQKMLQLLVGPGSGHELVAPIRGTGTLAIASGYSTTVKVEHLTQQGWAGLGCSGTVGPDSSTWATCEFSIGLDTIEQVRVTADKPVAAYAWKGGEDEMFIPLVSPDGTPQGTTLLAPAPRDITPVNLLALDQTCEATVGSETIQVSSGAPAVTDITRPQRIESECPIIGWIPGRGPAPLPLAINRSLSQAGMSIVPEPTEAPPWYGSGTAQCGMDQDIVAVGDEGGRATLVDTEAQDAIKKTLIGRETRRPGHADIGAATWTSPGGSDGTGHKFLSEATSLWPSIWDPMEGILPLAPTSSGNIAWLGPMTKACANDRGVTVRLAAVPFQGTPRVEMAAMGERLDQDTAFKSTVPLSEPISYGNAANEIPATGGMVETGLQGDVRLSTGFALVEPARGTRPASSYGMTPSILSAHLAPVDTERGEPQIIGPLFDLTLDPESRIAAPGDVHTFELLGQGHIRAPDGSISPLTLKLNVASSTEAEIDEGIEHDLGVAQAKLPVDQQGKVTTVTVTMPTLEGAPPDAAPSYQLTVTGTPQEGGDPIQAQATIQVVPNREISLAFEDGSKIKDLSTQEGHAEAQMVLTNEGTAVEDVQISAIVPEQIGWSVEVVDPDTGQPLAGGIVEELAPNAEKPLTLTIDAPGDSARVVAIDVTAQSTEDASVSSEATARVAHGVSVDVSSQVRPDLVTLHPGETTQVNLSLTNHGSPVNVQVHPSSAEGLILEPSLGGKPLNLGENGSDAAQREVPMNLTVAKDAPIGGVLVSTITLEIGVGQLEPVESLMSVRVRVVPDHSLEPVEALSILPGLRQAVELDVRATGDTDEEVDLSLLNVPSGWTVQAPDRLSVPLNSTAPLRMNVTSPIGAQAGSYDLALLATPDDGTEPIPIRAQIAVEESAAFHLDVPEPITLGLGADRTIQILVQNRGNTPGETTLEATSGLVDAQPRPATLTLAPGESTNVSLDVTATSTGTGTVSVAAPPGGNATLPVTVGRVELGVELVSTAPSSPEAEEPYRAVVRVTNSGTVAARDVDVALLAGSETIKQERIGRLGPGGSATLSMSVTELPSTQDLRIDVDPAGRYTQETLTDDSLTLSSDEVPAPPVALVIALIVVASVALRRT